MAKAIDITGQTFGRLLVKSRLPNDKHGKSLWECVCECGNKTATNGTSLKTGHSTSCGCSRGRDLEGQRFGRLVVLKKAGRCPGGGVLSLCRCDCGVEKIISNASLRIHGTKSCGCLQREVVSSMNTKDIAGQTFGRLRVIKRNGSIRSGSALWVCECTCGTVKNVSCDLLTSGDAKSCGCYGREVAAKTAVRNCGSENLEGFRRDPDHAARKSWIYLAEVAGKVDKIGVAFQLRKRFTRGHYSKFWWKREMSRAACCAIEKVMLARTERWLPSEPYIGKGESGPTEQRTGWVLDDVIQLLEQLCEECDDIGWEAFYEKHVV